MTQPIAAEPVLAWLGDPDLKTRTVARMKEHRAEDAFLQGDYQRMVWDDKTGDSVFRGCAIGCLLSEKTSLDQLAAGANLHELTAKTFGLTIDLAWAIDHIFEDQPNFDSAGDFAVAIVEAIPVGADLSGLCCSNRINDPCALPGLCIRHSPFGATELIEAVAMAPVPEPQESAA